jgi:hypothetical protein
MFLHSRRAIDRVISQLDAERQLRAERGTWQQKALHGVRIVVTLAGEVLEIQLKPPLRAVVTREGVHSRVSGNPQRVEQVRHALAVKGA